MSGPTGNGKNTNFIPGLQEAIEGLCSKGQPSPLVFSKDYSGYHAETSCGERECTQKATAQVDKHLVTGGSGGCTKLVG